MKKRNIVLIGPMGTGKSRAAKILADGFDWQLADTDRMMERETGMRIADYYRAAGAEAFEEKEMALINRVRYYHEAVIAMGGNYPMTEKKFRLLSEHGLVICFCQTLPSGRAGTPPCRETADYGLFRRRRLRSADAPQMDKMERPRRSRHQHNEYPSRADRTPRGQVH